MDTYYHLKSLATKADQLTVHCRDTLFKLGRCCPACYEVLRDQASAIDLELERDPMYLPLALAAPCKIGVIRSDLVAAVFAGLDPHAYLRLGRVSVASGSAVSDFSSFWGKNELVVRGDGSSPSRSCGTCGRSIYAPFGPRHLTEIPDPSIPVFTSQYPQLIVRADIYERLRGQKWPQLAVEPLPVKALQ